MSITSATTMRQEAQRARSGLVGKIRIRSLAIEMATYVEAVGRKAQLATKLESLGMSEDELRNRLVFAERDPGTGALFAMNQGSISAFRPHTPREAFGSRLRRAFKLPQASASRYRVSPLQAEGIAENTVAQFQNAAVYEAYEQAEAWLAERGLLEDPNLGNVQRTIGEYFELSQAVAALGENLVRLVEMGDALSLQPQIGVSSLTKRSALRGTGRQHFDLAFVYRAMSDRAATDFADVPEVAQSLRQVADDEADRAVALTPPPVVNVADSAGTFGHVLSH